MFGNCLPSLATPPPSSTWPAFAAALSSLSAHTCEAIGGKICAAAGQAFLVAFAPAQPRVKIRRTLWPAGIYIVKRAVINQLSLLDSTDAQ